MNGMQDVAEFGTARHSQDSGHQYVRQDRNGRKQTYALTDVTFKLPNHSMFVCFAPRENPKIAVAVVVSNAGLWSHLGGAHRIADGRKISSNDTLRAERVKEVARISNSNLMPRISGAAAIRI